MTHDRKCTIRPNQILNEINELLRKASEMMEELHEDYDGIKTVHILTGCGDTWAELKKRSIKL